MIALRQLAHESAIVSSFYFTAAMLLFTALWLPFVWVTPSMETLGLLIVMGVLGGFAQLLLTQSLRLAPAAAVTTFDYTQLLWVALLGYLLWSEIPTLRTIGGGALIVACGCFIVLSEVRSNRKRAA
jgi:drug/metabolite transporter (DMT)-like permease